MNVNELIKARRFSLGLTLEQVADFVGVTKSTVKKWESGFIKNMGRDKMGRLAQVLRISPTDLLDDDSFSISVKEDITPYSTSSPDLKDMLKSGTILFDGVNHPISKEDGELLKNIFLTIAEKNKKK